MAPAEEVASEEGLAAYAMDAVPEDLLQQATASSSNAASASEQPKFNVAAADPAVIEMLQGMEKLVSSRHRPRLQEWLKVLIKVKGMLDYTQLVFAAWPSLFVRKCSPLGCQACRQALYSQ